MNSSKQYFTLFFIVSLLAFLYKASFQFWAFLIFFYLVLSIVNIKNTFSTRLPLGELIVLSFLIDNVLAVTLLQILYGEDLITGQRFYVAIPIMDYLPFAFIAIQAFLVGYYNIKVPGIIWIDFVKSFDIRIEKKQLYLLLLIGLCGPVFGLLNISYLNFVAYTLTGFFTCGLIGLMIYTRSIKNFYFLAGLAVNILVVIRSGMFGSLIYFIIYSSVIFAVMITSNGKKINWYITVFAFIIGALSLAYLQNIKSDYREIAWNTGEASSDVLFNTVNENISSANINEKEFYLPILYRMNQGYQVSSVMKKVPVQEPFANGETIINTISAALVPRFLDPDKEKAGGRAKIERFTNIVLVRSTSMNIGILGEAYANFGIYGSFIFLFIYGIAVGNFEKFLLNFSLKQPMILLFFPLYFQVLFGSGTDFLMVINTIVKSSVIIFFILYIINRVNDKRMSTI